MQRHPTEGDSTGLDKYFPTTPDPWCVIGSGILTVVPVLLARPKFLLAPARFILKPGPRATFTASAGRDEPGLTHVSRAH